MKENAKQDKTSSTNHCEDGVQAQQRTENTKNQEDFMALRRASRDAHALLRCVDAPNMH